MKTVLRNIAADVMYASGLTAVVRRSRKRSLVILTYHRVLPADQQEAIPFPDLAVTPETLDAHVRCGQEYYQCVSLAEAMERLRTDKTPGKPLLVFTFDDGYEDNFTYARPVLSDLGVRATFFVITSLVDATACAWYDRLGQALLWLKNHPSTPSRDVMQIAKKGLPAESRVAHAWSIPQWINHAKSLDLEERRSLTEQIGEVAQGLGWQESPRDRIMTRKQLAGLAEEGHEIASHTRTHPILTQLSPGDLEPELKGSMADLSDRISRQVVSLSYPNGDHNGAVVAAARSAGYQYAVTTTPGLNGPHADPLCLNRVFASQERLSRPSGAPSGNLLQLELADLARTIFLRRQRGLNDT